MNTKFATSGLVAGLMLLSGAASLPAATFNADIVVVGGSFSAPAAAIEAARANPSLQILLLEPSDWIGGQATTQGVSAIDYPWHQPAQALVKDFPTTYLPSDYRDFITRIKNAPAAAPGDGYAGDGACWVSRESYDPRTGAWAIDQMLAQFSNITVRKMTVLKSTSTTTVNDANGSGKVITGLTTITRTPANGYVPHTKFFSQEVGDWYSATNSADYTKSVDTVAPVNVGRGLVVIDATEYGDAMVLAGADYTLGRESTTEKFAENGTAPATQETGSQAIVYPFAMTGASTVATEDWLKSLWSDFNSYYADKNANYFSLGSTSWVRVWTYRRLKNVGTAFANDTANQGDVTMQNWNPGNDYPFGTIFKNKANAAAEVSDWFGGLNVPQLSAAEKHAVAWYFWMKANKTVGFDTRLALGSNPLNMMGTGYGLSRMPYLRCGRRVVGLENFRIMERDFNDSKAPNYNGKTSTRYFDTLGIGSYAVDVHGTVGSTGVLPHIELPGPFYIPLRALGSSNVRNLLVSGKNMAQTYITNAAYRLHTIEWASGAGAGAAAARMSTDSLTNYGILTPSKIRQIQSGLQARNPIHWAAFDAEAIPPQYANLIVNDSKDVQAGVPFPVEVYHPSAVRADIYFENVYIGQTTTRANGRLLATGLNAPAKAAGFEARLYNASNELIDWATQTGDVIMDDSDYRTTTSGTWTTSTSASDKFGTSYRFASSGDGTTKTTWSFRVNPGLYEVSVRYPAGANRANNAPFTVNYGSGSATVNVNQTTNGGNWVVLGNYTFTNAAASVVLANNAEASKIVAADAIRVRPLAAASIIVDNTGVGFNKTGTWTASTSAGFYGTNSVFANGTGSVDSARWVPDLPQSGTYQVYAWWTASSNRATATYKVHHRSGVASVAKDQTVNGGSWQLLGTYEFYPGNGAYVELTDSGIVSGKVAVADAIRFSRTGALPAGAVPTPAGTPTPTATATPSPTPTPTATATPTATPTPTSTGTPTPTPGFEVITDNTDAAFTASTNWWATTSTAGFYGTNYQVRSTAAVSDAATWSQNLPVSGTYKVYARWTTGSNRSTTASYFVYHTGGSAQVTVNQQQNNGTWILLGTYNFNAGTAGRVALSCWTTAGFYVVADAVKFELQ
jgi:hypothetical protein